MLEKLIAYHCGPALAGIKPSNMVACHKSRIENVHEEISKLNNELNKKDIYLNILCECEKRVLVMVYRKKVLQKHLQNADLQEFLIPYGYAAALEVEEYIEILKSRMKENSFPHEIGVFLGYPLHDIHGYINHRNDGCLLTGDWKVYKDAETAEKLFSRYKACRHAIVKRLAGGLTLAQLFCAA